MTWYAFILVWLYYSIMTFRACVELSASGEQRAQITLLPMTTRIPASMFITNKIRCEEGEQVDIKPAKQSKVGIDLRVAQCYDHLFRIATYTKQQSRY